MARADKNANVWYKAGKWYAARGASCYGWVGAYDNGQTRWYEKLDDCPAYGSQVSARVAARKAWGYSLYGGEV